jgi:putative DNA primase/helicase
VATIATKGLSRTLADAICDAHRFARDSGGKLYVFRGGAYRVGAERLVKSEVKRLLNVWRQSAKWSPMVAAAIVEYIGVDARELWERPRLDLMNVQNGLLRISDRTLLPHSADHLSPVQLPVVFDPVATCPAIEQFASDVFPADATALAWEIPAYLMRPATSIQKAVLAIGPGGNGKSVWLRLQTAFLGKDNTSGLSLHKLESDRFAVARLHGKLANICPDLPSEHLAGTSVFKAITGGDAVTGEYKFRDSFDFVPFSRLVFSANHPPRSEDASPGFFDRWHVIPFERSFRGTDAEIPSHVLDSRLQTPGELSGLLNKALDSLEQIDGACAFSTPPSVQAACRDFQATTDPLAVWLDRFTIDDPAAFVVKKTLRTAFNAHLERQGRPAMTETAFGRAFAKHRQDVEAKQRTVSGLLQWCYVGIGMIHPAGATAHPEIDQPCERCEIDSQGSQGSQGFPYLVLPTNRATPEQEQVRLNPVNAVNPVKTCDHLDADTWVVRDGVAYCSGCNKFIGRVAAEEDLF